jgi:hypothetical protein
MRGVMVEFLADCESGSPVPDEMVGSWDRIVSAIKVAGWIPKLVHNWRVGMSGHVRESMPFSDPVVLLET